MRNILMLQKRRLIAGRGWGRCVRGLAPDGAAAVVCDRCLESEAPLKWVCTACEAEDERTRTEEISAGPFDHDKDLHHMSSTCGIEARVLMPDPTSLPQEPLLLTFAEAARLLGVFARTIRRMADDGEFTPVRVRRKVFLAAADLLAW